MNQTVSELLPFLIGGLFASVAPIRSLIPRQALITMVSLVTGITVASAAGELAGTMLTAMTSIIIDSGVAAAGVIGVHFLLRKFNMHQSQSGKP